MIDSYKLPADHVLVLRACHKGRASSHGFVWPEVGEIAEAPDWDPRPVCGYGLHGWLWGLGSVRAAAAEWAFSEEGVVWLVVEVLASTLIDKVDGDDKVKFPRGLVVHEGDLVSCLDAIRPHMPVGTITIGGTATAGDGGTATAGDGGTATAGYYGTATAGYYGTATAGGRGTATAGDGGTATAGGRGTATVGDGGTATVGDRGTATVGDGGTATAGYYGTATAGRRGTATAGDRGTATAGDRGTATVGDGGTIWLKHWDAALQRYRWVVGETGIDGIEPYVPYTLDTNGRLVKK